MEQNLENEIKTDLKPFTILEKSNNVEFNIVNNIKEEITDTELETDATVCYLNTGERHISEHQDLNCKIVSRNNIKKTYECKICFKIWKSSNYLRKHLLRHTDEKRYKCTKCNKKYKAKQSLLLHMDIHSTKWTQGCKICNKRYSSKRYLERHLKDFHIGGNLLKCSRCNKKFKRKHDLETHLNLHTNKLKDTESTNDETQQLYDCTHCERKFRGKIRLSQHMSYHKMERKYECSNCHLKFKRKLELGRHLQTHVKKEIVYVKMLPTSLKQTEDLSLDHSNNGIKNPVQNIKTEKISLVESVIIEDIHNVKLETSNNVAGFNIVKLDNIKQEITDPELETDNTGERHVSENQELIYNTVSGNNLTKAYKCKICYKNWKSNDELKQHMLSHADEKTHKCTKCDRKYKSRQYLLLHMGVHNTKVTQSCKICNKIYSSKIYLEKHIKDFHTDGKMFKCYRCNQIFTEKHDLETHFEMHGNKFKSCEICHKKFHISKLHMKTQAGENLFGCFECDKEITEKTDLDMHSKGHTIKLKKMFYCKICSKEYQTKSGLSRHMKNHTRKNLSKCPQCGREFVRKWDMEQHLKSHLNLKFSCPVCNKSLVGEKGIELHMKIHTRKNMFKCSICLREYTTNSILKRHMQRHSQHKKMFCCKICYKEFKTRSDLSTHIKNQFLFYFSSEKMFYCKICCKEYQTKSGLSRHIKNHTRKNFSKCPQCGREFVGKWVMEQHLKSHLNLRFSCQVCNKSFVGEKEIELHMKIHTRKNMFKCSICLREYTSNSILNRHMQSHKKISSTSFEPTRQLSPGHSNDEIKNRVKNIKTEKINSAEKLIIEDVHAEKEELNIEEITTSTLPLNSCISENLCKEEVILPD